MLYFDVFNYMLKCLGVDLKAFYFRFKAQHIREEEGCNKLTINREIYDMLLFMIYYKYFLLLFMIYWNILNDTFMIYKFCFLIEASCPFC